MDLSKLYYILVFQVNGGCKLHSARHTVSILFIVHEFSYGLLTSVIGNVGCKFLTFQLHIQHES